MDVGCGNGASLNLIHDAFPGIALSGGDVSSVAVKKARQRGIKCPLRQLNIEDEFPDKSDALLCLDVLEHIEDDEKAMRNLSAMGDWLIVSVPSGSKMDSLDIAWGHLRLYSRKSLVEKLERNGFEVVKTRQWGWPLYGPYRALKRVTPDEIQHGSSGNFGILQNLLARALYLVFFLCQFDKGAHLFALARSTRGPSAKKQQKQRD